MTQTNRPIPLRPQYPAAGHASSIIPRAMFCAFRGKSDPAVQGRDIKDVCRHFYRDDVATLQFLKAAASPGSTTDATFAGALVGNAVGAFLASLAPTSAIASLIPLGLSVDLETRQELTVPFRTTAPAARPWIAENDAIPVSSGSFGHAQLGPAGKVGVDPPPPRRPG